MPAPALEKQRSTEAAATGTKPALLAPQVSSALEKTMDQLGAFVVEGEAVNISGEISEKISELLPEQSSGGSGPKGDQAAAQAVVAKKKQELQIQVQRVQQMSEGQLKSGIKQSLEKQIASLIQEAGQLSPWVTMIRRKPFSAYRLATLVSRIRKIKEEIASLAQASLQRLKEMYMEVVLRLKVLKKKE